jgi:hypothetical protein
VGSQPGSTYLFVGLFDGGCVLGKSVQQNGGASFIEEIQDAIACLAHSQPGLSQLAFNLRGVGIVERWATGFEHLDAGQHFASNLFRHAFEPLENWERTVSADVKVDLPKLYGEWTHFDNLS